MPHLVAGLLLLQLPGRPQSSGTNLDASIATRLVHEDRLAIVLYSLDIALRLAIVLYSLDIALRSLGAC